MFWQNLAELSALHKDIDFKKPPWRSDIISKTA